MVSKKSNNPVRHSIYPAWNSSPWQLLPNLLHKGNNVITAMGAVGAVSEGFSEAGFPSGPNFLDKIHIG